MTTATPTTDLVGYRIVRDNVERDLRKKYPDADPAWMSREAARYAREFARHLLPVDAGKPPVIADR